MDLMDLKNTSNLDKYSVVKIALTRAKRTRIMSVPFQGPSIFILRKDIGVGGGGVSKWQFFLILCTY